MRQFRGDEISDVTAAMGVDWEDWDHNTGARNMKCNLRITFSLEIAGVTWARNDTMKLVLTYRKWEMMNKLINYNGKCGLISKGKRANHVQHYQEEINENDNKSIDSGSMDNKVVWPMILPILTDCMFD